MSREQWEIDRSALEIDEDACLGRGSFGEVHKGRWRGTEVAVKRLREDMSNDRELLEFRRELAIVNHLAHPNIVQFLGAITNSMPLCIISEFLPGGNLADILSRHAPRESPQPRSCQAGLDATPCVCAADLLRICPESSPAPPPSRGENNPVPVGKAIRWLLDTRCAPPAPSPLPLPQPQPHSPGPEPRLPARQPLPFPTPKTNRILRTAAWACATCTSGGRP